MLSNYDQPNKNPFSQHNNKARAGEETRLLQSEDAKTKKNYERDIFEKKKMNLSLPATINFLNVSSDWLVILMSNQLLFRLNLKQPEKQLEIFLEKFITGQRVSTIFLDPTGVHLLLALTPKSPGYSAELMYLNKNSNKPKILSKVSHLFAIIFSFSNTPIILVSRS